MRSMQAIVMSFGCCLLLSLAASGQQVAPPTSSSPRFAYTFSNFVWWNDADLRSALKHKIPGLPDELTPFSPMEREVRVTLVELLKSKGIHADVLCIDPSPDAMKQQRVAEAPPPSIKFSVTAPPEILVEGLILENPIPSEELLLRQIARDMAGKPYDTGIFWMLQGRIASSLQTNGYLSAVVKLKAGAPHEDSDRYLVPLIADVDSGPQYKVAKITADGGSLTRGRELSSYFMLHEGDIASTQAFGLLPSLLRSTYTHVGYMDVEVNTNPVLDLDHASASFNLQVIPGEQYHLRTLAVKGLDARDEQTVRALLGLSPGDIYDEDAITALYRKIADPANNLHNETLTFSPKKDQRLHIIDLTLNFFKATGN